MYRRKYKINVGLLLYYVSITYNCILCCVKLHTDFAILFLCQKQNVKYRLHQDCVLAVLPRRPEMQIAVARAVLLAATLCERCAITYSVAAIILIFERAHERVQIQRNAVRTFDGAVGFLFKSTVRALLARCWRVTYAL